MRKIAVLVVLLAPVALGGCSSTTIKPLSLSRFPR
jgi:hypothetical protein